jgi:hypothetical protein
MSVRVGGVRAQRPYGRLSDFAGGHTAPSKRSRQIAPYETAIINIITMIKESKP